MRWHLLRRPLESTGGAADDALHSAEARLERVKNRAEEVHQEVDKLQRYREANHFTEMVRASLRRI